MRPFVCQAVRELEARPEDRPTNPDARLSLVRKALIGGRAWLSLPGSDRRFRVGKTPDSPCRVGCPAGVNAKGYVGLISAGRFEAALEEVRARNPLPAICGRVCTHPCESECRRGDHDAPVAIRPLKRFIADFARHAAPACLPERTAARPERIAVIGSGPAGLTAANDLARLGYQVTVFEAHSRPGGMLVVGIPRFRLPRDVIEQEVESIFSLGVRLEVASRVSDPGELLRDGFSAVLCATGAHRTLKLGLAREDELEGVVDALTFLRQADSNPGARLHGTVLVVGGGNSALDSARTALRMGADRVEVLYRRTRREMPALPSEIAEAEAEGAKIRILTLPAELLHDGARLTGVRCVRTRLGTPDESGRRRPEVVPGSGFTIPATKLISAVGQRPDTEHLAGTPLSPRRDGTLAADALTAQTAAPGIFAGGDVVTGPLTVIDAIAAGHRAARGIHAALSGATPEPGPRTRELECGLAELAVAPVGRTDLRELDSRARQSFAEVEQVMSEAEAMTEAARCLRCGPCDECVRCSSRCAKHRLALTVPGASGSIVLRVPRISELVPDASSSFACLVSRAGSRDATVEATVLVSRVDPTLCRACGSCLEACAHEAVSLVQWQGELKTAQVDTARCRGCGVCATACPSGAIAVPGDSQLARVTGNE
ncbi:4Fe-4S dicluster domain-containing protein [candidate division WOR-3 bacterium]|nr:4Fe-4S dicluster domain-containing protein [candidate division WOR-3 bacterium]